MTKRPRRNHTPAFKAKVALAAVKGDKILAELAQRQRPHSSLDRRTPDEAYFGSQAIASAA